MTERDVIVRCPGCGNGKVIAMAVGQLLQCDICRTTFHAPIDGPDEGQGVPESDSFVVGPPLSPGEFVPHADRRISDPNSSTSGRGENSGQDEAATRSSWLTDDLELSSQPSPITSTGNPATDHAVCQQTVAAPSDAGDGAAQILDARSVNSWTIVSIAAGGVIVVTLTVSAVLLIRNFQNAAPASTRPAVQTAPAATAGSDSQLHWTDAAKASRRQNSVVAKVERVTYGHVKARDLQNQVVTTELDNLLAITVSVANHGPRARTFQNWYEHAFETETGRDTVAELTDDQQRSYSLLKFDDVSAIEGQRLSNTIEPEESVHDTVVFLIPEEIDRSAIDYFRLTLPGAAVGMNVDFRFQLPVNMIQGFAEPAAGTH